MIEFIENIIFVSLGFLVGVFILDPLFEIIF